MVTRIKCTLVIDHDAGCIRVFTIEKDDALKYGLVPLSICNLPVPIPLTGNLMIDKVTKCNWSSDLDNDEDLTPEFIPECPRCKGTGIIKVMSFQDPTQQIEVTCKICGGSGKLDKSDDTQ